MALRSLQGFGWLQAWIYPYPYTDVRHRVRSAFEFSTGHINRFARARIKCACSWTCLCWWLVNCWHSNSVDSQLLCRRICAFYHSTCNQKYRFSGEMSTAAKIFAALFSAECGRFECKMECKYLFMIHECICILDANAFNDLTWKHPFGSSISGFPERRHFYQFSIVLMILRTAEAVEP